MTEASARSTRLSESDERETSVRCGDGGQGEGGERTSSRW